MACPISETSASFFFRFAGFLRFYEACNIRWCDIDFKEDFFPSIFLEVKPISTVPDPPG